jgi:ATP/maltotriose-dependent transcriptional regulator MalT
MGPIQRAQGHLDRALRTAQRSLQLASAPGTPTLPAAGAAHVGIAEVAYQRGDLDTAALHLTTGLPLCRQFVIPDALATGSATLAWIRQARGDMAGAREAMDEAELVADPSMIDLLNPVPAQRARLLLAQGDIDAAARCTAERAVDEHDEPRYAREPTYLVLARVLLARERHSAALKLLQRLDALATAQGRLGSLIEIRALRALALRGGGDDTGAVAAITEALSLARAQGYFRVFIDEGPPMAALLGAVLAAGRAGQNRVGEVPVDYLARLLRAFAADPTSSSDIPGLITKLSERELEVLRLLAAGEPNQEIAKKLHLALNTVKKHVTHIFDKLGAANRTEAAARARTLGLL